MEILRYELCEKTGRSRDIRHLQENDLEDIQKYLYCHKDKSFLLQADELYIQDRLTGEMLDISSLTLEIQLEL